MRISGTETSSLILSQTKILKNDAQKKCQNKANRDGLLNPQNYNFNHTFTQKILMFSSRYESAEVDRRTWLHVSSEILWSTSSDTHQVVEIKKNSTKMYTPFDIEFN